MPNLEATLRMADGGDVDLGSILWCSLEFFARQSIVEFVACHLLVSAERRLWSGCSRCYGAFGDQSSVWQGSLAE